MMSDDISTGTLEVDDGPLMDKKQPKGLPKSQKTSQAQKAAIGAVLALLNEHPKHQPPGLDKARDLLEAMIK